MAVVATTTDNLAIKHQSQNPDTNSPMKHLYLFAFKSNTAGLNLEYEIWF